MLGHQLPALPSLGDFWQELPNMFNWLYGYSKMPILQPISHEKDKNEIDISWHPPSMIRPWHTSIPFELIRYAAANHLCVEINYQKKNGQLNKYLIEPYDLKRTKKGDLLLVALKHPTNDWRAFIVSLIKNINVTQTQFTPQYYIGLTPSSFR